MAGRALRDPAATALIDGNTGRRRSYGELHARTSALADALEQRGIRRGDRVGLLAHNSLFRQRVLSHPLSARPR